MTDPILKILKNEPHLTALQIWQRMVKSVVKDSKLLKKLKDEYPLRDQSVRVFLAEAEENGVVQHRIKFRSILKEWSLRGDQ